MDDRTGPSSLVGHFLLLTEERGNHVTVLSDRSQAGIVGSKRTVEVYGKWTNGEVLQFGGEDLFEAISKAAAAYQKYVEEHHYRHSGGLGNAMDGIEIDADLLGEEET